MQTMSKPFKPQALPVPVPSSKTGRAQTRVVKRLKPSQPGAIKLTRRYGPALICVRYRHNAAGTHRYTTVELVVDDAPVARRLPPGETIVLIRLPFDDTNCRRSALANGARWDADRRVWSMTRATAKKLGWLKRIVNA